MGPRPRPPAARRQRRRWRLAAVICALLVVSRSGPDTIGGATADVGGDHLTASGVEVGDSLDFYDYGDATPVSAPGDTAWVDGAFAGARSDLVPDTLTLDHYGTVPADAAEPWWDDAWRSRRCFDVDHTTAGATTEDGYQVRLLIDTQTPLAAGEFDADAQDLRAARHDGGGFVDLDLVTNWDGSPIFVDSNANVVNAQTGSVVIGPGEEVISAFRVDVSDGSQGTTGTLRYTAVATVQ